MNHVIIICEKASIGIYNFLVGVGLSSIPEIINSLDPAIVFITRVLAIISFIVSIKYFIEATKVQIKKRKGYEKKEEDG